MKVVSVISILLATCLAWMILMVIALKVAPEISIRIIASVYIGASATWLYILGKEFED